MEGTQVGSTVGVLVEGLDEGGAVPMDGAEEGILVSGTSLGTSLGLEDDGT